MNRPKLKFTFSHYKFEDKRICDTEYGYEDDGKMGVIICPNCGNLLSLLKTDYNKCICGTIIEVKKNN